MSKVDTLITQLCPDGVEFRELGELGDFYGGLTGKSKNDFQDGNAKFVTYMNVFSNIAIKTDINIFVRIGENENQNRVEYRDVIFTGSSETPDECGMSSVLTEKITEPLYLNSFCFGYRLRDKDLFLPDFLKYLFRDDNIRKQIGQTASGVTRFNVSKKRFAKIIIPIPPIAVQQEIANILDKFTRLQAELQAELQSRRKQYEYYRDGLMDFEGKEVEWKTLGEETQVYTGGEAPTNCIKGLFPNDFYKYPIFANGLEVYGYTDNYKINKDAVTISSIGANTGTIYYRKAYFTPIIRLKVVIPKSVNLLARYLFYYLSSTKIYSKKSSVPNLNADDVKKIKIPIPSLAEQNRIVAILDKFDALLNDISLGLPAVIQARHKQYEYYRGKLLDFNKISNG